MWSMIEPENVAQATISTADEAVRAYDTMVGETLTTEQLRNGSDAAVAAIYAAAVALEEAKRIEEFLSERQVRRHGNARNPYQRFVRAFVINSHPMTRSSLCKTAAVIALARLHRVAPAGFAAWRKAWPVEKAATAYRKALRANKKSECLSQRSAQPMPEEGATAIKVGQSPNVTMPSETDAGMPLTEVPPIDTTTVRLTAEVTAAVEAVGLQVGDAFALYLMVKVTPDGHLQATESVAPINRPLSTTPRPDDGKPHITPIHEFTQFNAEQYGGRNGWKSDES